MFKITSLLCALVLLLAGWTGCSKANPPASGGSGESATYSCPMHPDVTRSSPGQCPKCGMDLERR
ncbi:MAG: hypothetical protein HY720_17830 [Planctomycetes bacterium]|nr:hypothetical protein [Planctomycetota bacterium]